MPEEKPVSLLRSGLAATLGLGLFFLANTLGIWWLHATIFASDAFYDGSAAILALALPGFLGGLVIGWGGKPRGLTLAVIAFVLLAVLSMRSPLWRVPLVSPHSVHSGVMHYFLRNPIVALTFGALGAWLAEQFALGRFRLADAHPLSPQQMGDD